MKAHFKLLAVVIAVSGISPQGFNISSAKAATANASSGSWFNRKNEDNVWQGTESWAQTAKINWSAPIFEADKTSLPTKPVPFSERKFNKVIFPQSRVWEGFIINGTGPLGSLVIATGTGSSTAATSASFYTFYGANWVVTADGSGDYKSRSIGDDPYQLFASDFQNVDGDTYSLLVPFGMEGGSLGNGSFESYEFSMNYGVLGFTSTLLGVRVTRQNGNLDVSVAINGNFGNNLQFYLLDSIDQTPIGASTPGTPISFTDLESLILGNVDAFGAWMSPIYIGAELSQIPVPTNVFPDGSLAFTGGTAVAASAAVPDLSTWMSLILGFGIVGTGLRVRRERNTVQFKAI